MQTLDQFTFYPTLAEVRGAALIFFSAVSCGACRQWKRLLDNYAAEPDAPPIFEVDAGIDQALAREFEVFHLPALFLFVDGEYHRPVECAATLPTLRAAVAAALALPSKDAP